MTADELAKLKELESKATKGPWVWQNYGKKPEPYIICQTCCYPSPRTTVAWGNYTGGQGWPAVGDSGVFDRESVEANAALIAALRNAAPALIAMAEWANAAKKEIEYALEPGVFGPHTTCDDPQFSDGRLLEMCKRCGFGAVMHTVEHLWRTHGPHPGAEHTCAAAADVRRGWIDRADRLLAAYPKDTTSPARAKTEAESN